jgi:hypothetical protein
MEGIQTEKEDLDILNKKMHILDLLGVQYKKDNSILDFYDNYRKIIIRSLKKKGDIIMWQNNKIMTEDEELSPTFEELIFTIVLTLIDTRLPGHVKDEYFHLIRINRSIMDFKTEILDEVPAFLTAIESNHLPQVKTDDGLHSR